MKLSLLLILILLSTCVYADARLEHDATKNKKLILSVFAALESGDLELLNRVFLPEGKSVIGSQVRKRGGPFEKFSGAAPFPASLDEREVIVESIFSENDKVAIQSLICGIHARELVGYKPTKKKICARYTNLYTIENGKIIENVVGFDPQLRKTLELNKNAK